MKFIKAKISHRTHRKLELESIVVGEQLVFDIWIKKDDEYLIIIKAGTLLIEKIYHQLQLQKNLYISLNDIDQLTLTSSSLLRYIQHNQNKGQKTIEFLYEVNNRLFTEFFASERNLIDTTSVDAIVKSIIYLVKNNPKYLKETIAYFNDACALEFHSIHVAIYAVSLSYCLDFKDEELLRIGTAGLLHDLGKKVINDNITKKESKLNLQEMQTMQEHSKFSVDIVKKNHIYNPYIVEAIMHHHEALDGSGYPEHLTSKDITPFAAILSICDNFDALTSDRPYRDKYSTFEALKKIMKEESMVNKFNQEYLRIFLESLLA